MSRVTSSSARFTARFTTRFIACAALALAFGDVACSMTMPTTNILGKRAGDPRPETYLGMPLRSGQLVLSESADSTSFVFPLIPKNYYAFTHIAVLSMEDGEPWVYDVTGAVKAFPLRKRLMDNVKGKMYRRKLLEYASPNVYVEIYDPPEGADPEKIAAFAKQKFKEGVEFDSHFDFHDHSKLFCTEFVELAIRDAGGQPLPIEPSNPNPSVVEGMKWLGVPPGEAVPVGRYAHPTRYVGAFGQFRTRTQAWSYFEAKREIHRRFSMDQRLGYVVAIDDNGQIEVRPEIIAFVSKATHLFDREEKPPEPGNPRIAEEVRKLAADLYGPFPDVASPDGRATGAPRSAP